MNHENNNERRSSSRKSLSKDMEFIMYLDAYKATSVNISDSGIRFTTENPIAIRLVVEVDGKKIMRDAQLVWASKDTMGRMNYGFEFIPDIEE